MEVDKLNKTEHDELCCSYAAILLHEGGVSITEEKLNKVIGASGNGVEAFWPGLFAKALAGKDVAALIMNVGAAPAQAGEFSPVDDTKAVVVEEEPVAEEEQEICMDGIFGFGDEEEY